MIQRIVLFLCVSLCAWATVTIKPIKDIKTAAAPLDMTREGERLCVCLENGAVLIVSTAGKQLASLRLPANAGRAISADMTHDGTFIAIGAQDGNIYLWQHGRLMTSGFHTQAMIKRIAFDETGHILITLIDGRLISYDWTRKRIIYSVQVSESTLSDSAVSSDKKRIALVGESGIVHILHTINGRQIASYANSNVDNIYKCDYQNGYVISAGQDRRCVIYAPNGTVAARFDASFLVYAAALSPSAQIAAATMDEANTISLFSVKQKKCIAQAKGHSATLNRILFTGEKTFVSIADERHILFWRVP